MLYLQFFLSVSTTPIILIIFLGDTYPKRIKISKIRDGTLIINKEFERNGYNVPSK